MKKKFHEWAQRTREIFLPWEDVNMFKSTRNFLFITQIFFITKCWFEEGGCIDSSEMESGSWRDCCQSGVNLATPVYGDKPGSKLELRYECFKNKKQRLDEKHRKNKGMVSAICLLERIWKIWHWMYPGCSFIWNLRVAYLQ